MKLKKLLAWVLVFFGTFLFLSLCNWSYHLSDWNGFSRFILGVEGVAFLIWIIDENFG